MYVLMEFNDLLVDVAGVVEEDFFAQASAVDVDVDFGGGDALVPKHNLYDTQVGTTLNEMRSKAVTKCVRRDVLGYTGTFCILPNEDKQGNA